MELACTDGMTPEKAGKSRSPEMGFVSFVFIFESFHTNTTRCPSLTINDVIRKRRQHLNTISNSEITLDLNTALNCKGFGCQH